MEISSRDYTNSSNWLKRNGRPLELARWRYLFEGDSNNNVIYYLRAFQNEDGGFGHGLEPDFWLPKSSPMATWAACQILFEVDARYSDHIVKNMIAYLVHNYDKDTGLWTSVLPETNDYPHAPWWHWASHVQQQWMFNPSAELAGYLIHWAPPGSVAEKIGWSTTEKAIRRLMDSDKMDRHEINNYQVLAKILKNHEKEFNKGFIYSLREVSSKLFELAEACIQKDITQWPSGYAVLPLDMIDSPENPLYNKLSELVENNLHFYLEQLSEDGTWELSWDWDSYPASFPVAQQYWKGILTVNRYKQLQAFGYI